MQPDDDKFPEGSRWLHLWTVTDSNNVTLWLGFQYETVGVSITAAPALAIEPSAALALFDQLATLPRTVRMPDGVSIRLDDQD